jgi:hypothetical protein
MWQASVIKGNAGELGALANSEEVSSILKSLSVGVPMQVLRATGESERSRQCRERVCRSCFIRKTAGIERELVHIQLRWTYAF